MPLSSSLRSATTVPRIDQWGTPSVTFVLMYWCCSPVVVARGGVAYGSADTVGAATDLRDEPALAADDFKEEIAYADLVDSEYECAHRVLSPT
jgi:hypothetical protein